MLELNSPKTEDLVSVIIPTFNRRDLVQDALASVAAQSWHAVEVIVVDDGSEDGTKDVVTDLVASGYPWPIAYHWQQNSGAGAARNHGRTMAKGQYLLHLDSDDVLRPHAISALVNALVTVDNGYVVGLVANTDLHGNLDVNTPIHRPCILQNDIFGSGWPTHAALYRRQLLDTLGGFDTCLRIGEDRELNWRILETFGAPALLENLIADRRVHDGDHLHATIGRQKQLQCQIYMLEYMLAKNRGLVATSMNSARILALMIEFGATGDWAFQRRARDLLSEVLSANPIQRALAFFFSAPKTLTYWRAVRFGKIRVQSIARRLVTRKKSTIAVQN